MKLPAFQFYPGDWMKDPQLRSVSLAAKGLWIDLLCLMFENERRGYLQTPGQDPIKTPSLARMVGGSPEEVATLLAELEHAGVLSKDNRGVIFSRRIVRDERIRKHRAEGGEAGAEHGIKGAQHGHKGGRPKGVASEGGFNGGFQKPPLKPPPSVSTSVSSSPSPSERGENTTEKEVGAEPGKNPGSGPAPAPLDLMDLPLYAKDQKLCTRWAMLKATWQAAYPGINVVAEVRKAHSWEVANPAKRKVDRPRFLNTWLGREQDRRGGRNGEHRAVGGRHFGGTQEPDKFAGVEIENYGGEGGSNGGK